MLKFSEDHEWANLDADICAVGISPHAVEQLGDIVFVELPEVGDDFAKGDEVAVVDVRSKGRLVLATQDRGDS